MEERAREDKIVVTMDRDADRGGGKKGVITKTET
jgi:hypothetical protein